MPSLSIIIPTRRFGRQLDPFLDARGCAFPGGRSHLYHCLGGRGWRRFFDSLGGFPDWPLSEDVEMFRRARGRAGTLKLPGVVTISAARCRGNGLARQLLIDAGLILRHALGAAPTRLAESDERGSG